jgi:hypothetical protein
VFFHGSHSWIEKIAGGWSLSGILNIHSGFPWGPIYGVTGPGIYFPGSANDGYGTLRPVGTVSGAGTSSSNGTFMDATNPNYGGNATQFFIPPTYAVATGAFPSTAPAPPIGIHRNSLQGTGYSDVDISLAKGFGLPNNRVLGENAKFEIRTDMYNFFNKLNINTSTIDGFLGTVNPDGTIASVNKNFGVAGQALGSRTIQLQARFSF